MDQQYKQSRCKNRYFQAFKDIQPDEGHLLWNMLVENGLTSPEQCSFIHAAGIKHDADGDVIMQPPCPCALGEYNIPDCFLRSFFYMVAFTREWNSRQAAARMAGARFEEPEPF